MELLNKSLLRHWYVDHSLKSVLEATNETLSICPDKECIVCLKNILHLFVYVKPVKNAVNVIIIVMHIFVIIVIRNIVHNNTLFIQSVTTHPKGIFLI
jgi:hypothetical protein